ncbi:L-aspartate oxidase [Gluconobacter thailandicus]|uniref:L-aspartate oxidase n=1 Tax=Gluconobacter thailandicus TaxID=257438 RepID=A0AAP9ETE6_GLUTH|nr:L-aspartate oxidase [Gluconobacter thailandicus]QEH97138.1 L-aspartate oxidase [Gluconobacter thailandicus]
MTKALLSALAGQPVIVGAGLAGLSAALHLRQPCVILTPSPLGLDAASSLAQGGIAAAIGADDSPELHAADTLAAGAGLSVPEVVRRVTTAAPQVIQTLLDWGVPFARKNGALDLHLEAAHSRKRILHVGGDGSGAAIMQTLIRRVQARESITVLEGTCLNGLMVQDGRLQGVYTSAGFVPTSACLVASGGIGALYSEATSPGTVQGAGLAHAVRAGARVADMEFTQFHPTALKTGSMTGRRPLVSEAVRGAGAILVDERGERFTDELQSRDVVARAIFAHIREGHDVFLDGRHLRGAVFSQQFPGITAACHAIGVDPERDPIPISPAMHYHMGGLDVNERGRTSVSGLWAAGEAACTGLHGANRLASNSLLEAFLTGQWAAEDIDHVKHQTVPLRSVPTRPALSVSFDRIPKLMSEYAGILRDKNGLQALLHATLPDAETNDGALVAALVAQSALMRRESRGSHYRTDYPEITDPYRTTLTFSDLPVPERLPS